MNEVKPVIIEIGWRGRLSVAWRALVYGVKAVNYEEQLSELATLRRIANAAAQLKAAVKPDRCYARDDDWESCMPESSDFFDIMDTPGTLVELDAGIYFTVGVKVVRDPPDSDDHLDNAVEVIDDPWADLVKALETKP